LRKSDGEGSLAHRGGADDSDQVVQGRHEPAG
jgi:hypothetical protein